jgi:hypothetical protein
MIAVLFRMRIAIVMRKSTRIPSSRNTSHTRKTDPHGSAFTKMHRNHGPAISESEMPSDCREQQKWCLVKHHGNVD